MFSIELRRQGNDGNSLSLDGVSGAFPSELNYICSVAKLVTELKKNMWHGDIFELACYSRSFEE